MENRETAVRSEEAVLAQQKKEKNPGFILGLLALLFPYVLTLVMQGDLRIVPGHSAGEPMIRLQDGKQVTLEEYLPGLVAKQLSTKLFAYTTCSRELLQLQTLIARTELYRILAQENTMLLSEELLEVRAMTTEEIRADWGEVWYEEYYPQLVVAAYQTEGKIICFENKPIIPMYHFSSPGHTRTHEVLSYLPGKVCDADLRAPGAITLYYVSGQEYGEISLWVVDTEGFCEEIAVGERHLPVEDFSREILPLASEYVEIEALEEGYRIIVKGEGHSYGVSQWCANDMAQEGKTCEELVEYFYPGTQILQVDSSQPFNQ